MKAERVVLDTNVIISAELSPHGKPFACLSFVLDHAVLIIAPELLDELETRLARPVTEGRNKRSALRRPASQWVFAGGTGDSSMRGLTIAPVRRNALRLLRPTR